MHKVLYITFVLLISLSTLNQVTGIFLIKKLDGFVTDEKTVIPEFSNAGFFSGNWQDSISHHISENINLKPTYIRFRNYFDYKLFDIVHVNSVFKGKNDYLFYGSKYFMEGKSNASLSLMKNNVIKLKYIQDSLSKQGIQVLYAIAPEKMFVYPEFLPEEYPLTDIIRFSYDNYIQLFSEHQLDYIDFNAWFVKMKDKSPYALIAKGGKHWTRYYAIKAADSIGDYLREKGCKVSDFDLIHPIEKGHDWPPDIDTWRAANLPFSYEENNIIEVDFEISEGQNDNVIYLADSYFHALAWSGLLKKMHGELSEFWYYNKERNNVDNIFIGETSHNVFKEKEVKAYIILISVGNLKSFDFGFINYFDEE